MNLPPMLIEADDREGRVLEHLAIPARSDVDESTLQSVLFSNPSLLATDSVPFPIAREVWTEAGIIDNLYLHRSARIAIVETKLIKNPQAHREVISQVIGYAAAVARLSYATFSEAIKEARDDGADLDALLAQLEPGEAARIEWKSRIDRALRMGDFDLFIVGDRISPQAPLAAEAITSAPTLRFRLMLVEMRIYQVGKERWPWIVVPLCDCLLKRL